MTGTGLAVEVPELGQVVRCRDRIPAVNEVMSSSLRIDPISGTRPQHLVRASVLGAGDVGLGKLTALVRA